MSLLAVVAIMLLVRLALFIFSRGTFERALCSMPPLKDTLLAAAALAAADRPDGEPTIECDVAAEKMVLPGMRARISLTFGARIVLIALVCQAIVVFAAAPAAIMAFFPALSTCLLPALDEFMLVSRGLVALPPKTVPERTARLIASTMCVALAWAAFFACMRNTQHVVGSALLAYLLLLAAYLVRRFGMRVARAFSLPQFEQFATGKTVLYLRSFADDRLSLYTPVTDCDLRSLLWPRISFEEFVGYCAGAVCGNLITIGRPGERLPRPGAWRSYFEDDAWQEAVRLTMLRCGTILLTTGDTESLAWEIRHIKEWGMLQKCVFLVPPLPEEQARRRIDLALSSLEVKESKRGTIPPAATIAGFRVLASGSIQWFMCAGRDWGAYFFAVVRGTSVKSRKLRVGAQAGGSDGNGKAPGEGAQVEVLARKKPQLSPKPVTKVMRRTLKAGSLYEAGENCDQAAKIYASALEELRKQPDASPEAIMYLRVMRMRCEIRAGAGGSDGLVEELEGLARDSMKMSCVWTSPTSEVLYADEFRSWVYYLVACCYADMKRVTEERDAFERCYAESVSAGVVWRVVNAQRELAAISWDPSEMREHAQRALDLATSISDAREMARAREWLAHADSLDEPPVPEWAEKLVEVIDTLIDLKEPQIALAACRRGLADAQRLSDEGARQKLLSAQRRCSGA